MSLKISVIIVSYNRPEPLYKTVHSLVPMVNGKGEIVIVNQAAPESIKTRFQQFANVRYFNLPKPAMVAARNYGILTARYDILLFVDDDITPLPDLIPGHLAAYASDSMLAGVAGGVFEPASDKADGQASLKKDLSAEKWARGCNVSYRRTVLMALGRFDEVYIYHYDDADMSYRVRRSDGKMIFEEKAAVVHRSIFVGGTRPSDAMKNSLAIELDSYRRIFYHSRDAFIFYLRYFRGKSMWHNIWQQYSGHVGLSRYPWRWFSKIAVCAASLLQALFFKVRELAKNNKTDSLPCLIASLLYHMPGLVLNRNRSYALNDLAQLRDRYLMNSIFLFREELPGASLFPKKIIDAAITMFNPKSILDLGCGTGRSLDYFISKGIDAVGVEGSALVIRNSNNKKHILRHNLNKKLNLNRKFDMIWSFEFVEHIHPAYLDNMLQTFSNHSDRIVMSAANPGQGGKGHLNEQPESYWIKKFRERGYRFCKDKMEKLRSIDEPYSKNMLVFER